ncbi:hypothetical protein [Hyphomicrobium sp.]|uniref:hypothetical protein n=1 Tax=Hyphomicrobium sp. TaxID=82 RepID=UPI001DFE17A9|nr:hypothetical protein [Hyphomicrobium sp.]MBY0560042.1 hypothetical protein [Hyphomicrobium sp.]
MRIVFTGPAIDGNGNTILRANLAAACLKADLSIQPAVRQDTEILVASRTDTVKAKAAAARGLEVIGYPEYINKYLSGVKLPTSGRANIYTDFAINKLNRDLLVPDFTNNETLAALDSL